MENKFFTVSSQKNANVSVQVIAGHFATDSSHRNHYIDISELKSSSSVAKNAARQLAIPYLSNTQVDVIVYMDGTEILAAYLADELLQAGVGVVNEGSEIYLVTPMLRVDGKFLFHENVMKKIEGKNVVLMVASLTAGATVNRVIECLDYYRCKLAGISAIFSIAPEIDGRQINSLFSLEDVPDYEFYKPSECKLCKAGVKIDAFMSSEGYTKLEGNQ
jgi:orotate phosphoribosyltransferase